MTGTTLLDVLEAEAIYILRETRLVQASGAPVFRWQGFAVHGRAGFARLPA